MLPLAVFVLAVLAQQTFADEPEPIVGGTAAKLGEFPYQVSLTQYGQHFCGGSIISPTKILTAAHCVSSNGRTTSPSNVRVISGSIITPQGQSHTVKSITVHPQYKDSASQSWVNDVAVMTLNNPIQYNQYQGPIQLADSPPTPGTQCTLSGWGLTRANGQLASTLLKMNQAVVSNQQCQNRHQNMPIASSHLCAYNQYGIGACQGDSGGPLVCQGKQCGITSWVLPCAVGYPDAYTSVYHHRNFILSS